MTEDEARKVAAGLTAASRRWLIRLTDRDRHVGLPPDYSAASVALGKLGLAKQEWCCARNGGSVERILPTDDGLAVRTILQEQAQ